jgi:uncharacterized cofD-like protein
MIKNTMTDKKIVMIGGGTGSFTLLDKLKDVASDITALVTMADDGGSTGQLRDELGVLPPGDVRQCLVALSNAPQLRDLFNYRFDEGSLKGHAMGNLFLTALEKMTGDFAVGVELASDVLNITGRVEPMTLTNVRLVMIDQDGRRLDGESQVREGNFDGKQASFSLEPLAVANPRALEAIERADIVVVAPGNLYGSLAPALVVPGVGDALRTTKAHCVYVCNLVTKPGQTDGYTVADFASEIERFAGGAFLDTVLYNTERPSDMLIEKYAAEGECMVAYTSDDWSDVRYTPVGKNLLSGTIWKNSNVYDPIASTRTLIRHDSAAVAREIVQLG